MFHPMSTPAESTGPGETSSLSPNIPSPAPPAGLAVTGTSAAVAATATDDPASPLRASTAASPQTPEASSTSASPPPQVPSGSPAGKPHVHVATPSAAVSLSLLKQGAGALLHLSPEAGAEALMLAEQPTAGGADAASTLALIDEVLDGLPGGADTDEEMHHSDEDAAGAAGAGAALGALLSASGGGACSTDEEATTPGSAGSSSSSPMAMTPTAGADEDLDMHPADGSESASASSDPDSGSAEPGPGADPGSSSSGSSSPSAASDEEDSGAEAAAKAATGATGAAATTGATGAAGVAPAAPCRRVKVYKLRGPDWMAHGIGVYSCSAAGPGAAAGGSIPPAPAGGHYIQVTRPRPATGGGSPALGSSDPSPGTGMAICPATGDEILLRSVISPNTDYSHQQNSLIIWREPPAGAVGNHFLPPARPADPGLGGASISMPSLSADDPGPDDYSWIFDLPPEDDGVDRDVALSFQSPQDFAEIWDLLNLVRGQLCQEQEQLRAATYTSALELDFSTAGRVARFLSAHLIVEQVKSNHFGSLMTPRESLIQALHKHSATFFPSLFQTFEFAEDIGATNVLQALYTIVRCLFFLNDSAILEQIIGDNLLATIGILEYGPVLAPVPPPADSPSHSGASSYLPTGPATTYREFLQSPGRFLQPVPLDDIPDMEKLIHQAFQLQYLASAIMPVVLPASGAYPLAPELLEMPRLEIREPPAIPPGSDDFVSRQLFGVAFTNQRRITFSLVNNPAYMGALFDLITLTQGGVEVPEYAGLPIQCGMPSSQARQGVSLLRELSSNMKNFEESARDEFYGSMLESRRIFAVFPRALWDREERVRRDTLEILASVLDYRPGLIRAHMVFELREANSVSHFEAEVSDQELLRQIRPRGSAHSTLLDVLLDRLHCEPDFGMRLQLQEILKVLLNNPSSVMSTLGAASREDEEQVDHDELLDIFFRGGFAQKLMLPLRFAAAAAFARYGAEPARGVEHPAALRRALRRRGVVSAGANRPAGCIVRPASAYADSILPLPSLVDFAAVDCLGPKEALLRVPARRAAGGDGGDGGDEDDALLGEHRPATATVDQPPGEALDVDPAGPPPPLPDANHLLQVLLDLMTYLVQQHPYATHVVLGRGILHPAAGADGPSGTPEVLACPEAALTMLLRASSPHLVLSVVRLLRAVISMRSDSFIRHLLLPVAPPALVTMAAERRLAAEQRRAAHGPDAGADHDEDDPLVRPASPEPEEQAVAGRSPGSAAGDSSSLPGSPSCSSGSSSPGTSSSSPSRSSSPSSSLSSGAGGSPGSPGGAPAAGPGAAGLLPATPPTPVIMSLLQLLRRHMMRDNIVHSAALDFVVAITGAATGATGVLQRAVSLVQPAAGGRPLAFDPGPGGGDFLSDGAVLELSTVNLARSFALLGETLAPAIEAIEAEWRSYCGFLQPGDLTGEEPLALEAEGEGEAEAEAASEAGPSGGPAAGGRAHLPGPLLDALVASVAASSATEAEEADEEAMDESVSGSTSPVASSPASSAPASSARGSSPALVADDEAVAEPPRQRVEIIRAGTLSPVSHRRRRHTYNLRGPIGLLLDQCQILAKLLADFDSKVRRGHLAVTGGLLGSNGSSFPGVGSSSAVTIESLHEEGLLPVDGLGHGTSDADYFSSLQDDSPPGQHGLDEDIGDDDDDDDDGDGNDDDDDDNNDDDDDDNDNDGGDDDDDDDDDSVAAMAPEAAAAAASTPEAGLGPLLPDLAGGDAPPAPGVGLVRPASSSDDEDDDDLWPVRRHKRQRTDDVVSA